MIYLPAGEPALEFECRLIKVRRYFGQTQQGMDGLLGLGKKSWQRYESGGVQPGKAFFAALCKQGININWLLLGVGHMLRHPEAAQ